MSLNKKSVSIIIPNYNGRELLEKYLPMTFRAIENAGVAYEFILVDDCSSDDSVSWVKAKYPEIILSVNPINRGFSFTVNQGIKLSSHELVLLLNSDVGLEENYFENLWRYFEEEDTFGVMGRIMNANNSVEDAGRLIAFSGFKFKATRFYYAVEKGRKCPTAYLSGANALIRKEMLLQLEGFDEIFSPYYGEDVDLSFRAWRLGWKSYYEHEAICHHEVSKTIRSTASKRSLLAVVYRNKFILHSIHFTGLARMIWFLQFFFVEVLSRILIGKFWVIDSAFGFLSRTKQVTHSRNQLKKLMQKTNKETSLFDVKRNYFDPVVHSWKIRRI